MISNKNKIEINESLNELKKKLKTLDRLMQNSARFGVPYGSYQKLNSKYSKSNPFTSSNKSITN